MVHRAGPTPATGAARNQEQQQQGDKAMNTHVQANRHQGSRGTVLYHESLLAVAADPVMVAEVDAAWAENPGLTITDRVNALAVMCTGILRRHDYEVGLWRVLSPSEREAAPVLPGGVLRCTCQDTVGQIVTVEVTANHVMRLNCGCWQVEVFRPGPTMPYAPGMHLFPQTCGTHHNPEGDEARSEVVRRSAA
jgi:hypothetical protein